MANYKRDKTRRERYDQKSPTAIKLPLEICTINFMHDGNLGFLIRAAACFGVSKIHVIGSVPPRKILNPLSGSLYDFVEIKQYRSPFEFLDFCKNNKIKLISAEISQGAKSISSYDFDFSSRMVLVVGQEESGIPIEILRNSDKVYIPMPGVGFCLNTSQTANIFLYEAAKQMNVFQER